MNTQRRGAPWFLLIVYAVYFLYYFEDMQTSANTMVKQTGSRGMVHIYLIVLIVLLGVFFMSRGRWLLDDGFRSSFLLLIGWCALTDLLVGTSFWAIATHLGLLVLFYLIYYFSGHYIDNQQRYKAILALEFILWCVTLWYAIGAFLAFREYRNGEADVVLNMAYNMLVFIPVLLQLKNYFLKSASIAVSVIYIVVSLKRGAIITMAAMFLVLYLMGTTKKGVDFFHINTRTATKVLFAILAMVVVFVVVNNNTDGALVKRFSWEELQYGSNRNIIYTAAWEDIKNRNFLQFFLGKGSGSPLRIIGTGVHNEVLEVLFSYGLVGLVMYLVTVFRGIGRTVKLKKKDDPSKVLYAMGITYLIFVGLVGSALFSHMTFHIMMAMGLANSPVNTMKERRLIDG